jgi:hypothetical protein
LRSIVFDVAACELDQADAARPSHFGALAEPVARAQKSRARESWRGFLVLSFADGCG